MSRATPPVATTMPIHFTTVSLDEIGYEGWYASMRLNIRARVYDEFLEQDRDVFWGAFSKIVLDWNFTDEDGEPLPLPRDGLGPRDLPIDILNTLVLRYVEAMSDSAAIPKARGENSETTSRTNGATRTNGLA